MSNTNYKMSDKRKVIAYWITTGLVILELVYGATWDFNLLNKGFVATVMAHLGYPSYLPLILGTSKLLAAICLVLPGLIILKEWAYAGLMILFLGAFCSHIIVGDGISSAMVFLFVCIGLTIASYCLRPATRKITW